MVLLCIFIGLMRGRREDESPSPVVLLCILALTRGIPDHHHPPLPPWRVMSAPVSGPFSAPLPDLHTLLDETYRRVAKIQRTLFTSEEKRVLMKLNDSDRAIMLGTKHTLASVLAQVLIQQNIPLPRPV